MIRILVLLAYGDEDADAKVEMVKAEAARLAASWGVDPNRIQVISAGAAFEDNQHQFGRDLEAWAVFAGRGQVGDGASYHILAVVDAQLSPYSGRMVEVALSAGRPVLAFPGGARVSGVTKLPKVGRLMPRWSWN